ncbi:beta-lactamase-like protein [Truncatella angustata]|uniref:Beta-lactamase-like protein n=1 Tax=Truncatella angustata TaxID=152316 RepID=A0A9P8ZW22_9PEZI|nr:beta-lactamase-like protein [Truncatella angustata]KAH6651528.1 beta-lactamase-like protein [Truncatella angustata]
MTAATKTTDSHNIPSGAVARLSVIDTGAYLSSIPSALFLGPPVQGFENIPDRSPAWSFLVESPTGKKAVFDLSLSKDLRHVTPSFIQQAVQCNASAEAPKDVAQVLSENGVALESVQSIVWSHWHMDHVGDPSTFPNSTEVVVGPRGKEDIYPMYPEREDAELHENILKGKTVREITFDGGLKFYGLDALDFFGDGSFYLVDMPGHTLGHIGGLVRTTSNPDTFAVLGGDAYHSAGELRPTTYKPLPEDIPNHDSLFSAGSKYSSCPCLFFKHLQEKRDRTIEQPFFEVVQGHDVVAANDTLRKSQFPDAQDHLIYLSAHDDALRGVFDFYPKSANNWKELGWKAKIDWDFLRHLVKGLDGEEQ